MGIPLRFLREFARACLGIISGNGFDLWCFDLGVIVRLSSLRWRQSARLGGGETRGAPCDLLAFLLFHWWFTVFLCALLT